VARICDQNERQGRELRDAGEVLERVERQVRIGLADNKKAVRRYVKSIAIGRGLCGGCDAGEAGPVLDDDLLSPFLRQLLGRRTGEHIRRTARRNRDNDAHELIRVAAG
jgi:hypothetical protein